MLQLSLMGDDVRTLREMLYILMSRLKFFVYFDVEKINRANHQLERAFFDELLDFELTVVLIKVLLLIFYAVLSLFNIINLIV